jgi:rhomboid protease GluP
LKFESSDTAPARELPFVTIAVVVLCVGLWLAQVTHGVPVMDGRASDVIAWGGCLPLYVLTGESWRLVTALFVHLDITHLGLNMLIFAITAAQVERAFGHLRTLAIFLVGGILANAGYTWWAELEATPEDFGRLLSVLAGASGGLMALFGAMLVPSLLGVLGQQPWADLYAGRVDRRLLWTIAINIGICFVIPHWDPTINIMGALAGIVIGAILLVAPRHAGTTAALVRFAAIGLLLAACVSGLGHSGDREFLAQLRVAYDAWRTTHP